MFIQITWMLSYPCSDDVSIDETMATKRGNSICDMRIDMRSKEHNHVPVDFIAQSREDLLFHARFCV